MSKSIIYLTTTATAAKMATVAAAQQSPARQSPNKGNNIGHNNLGEEDEEDEVGIK